MQRLLRHKTLRITLETYVRWWPKRDRPRVWSARYVNRRPSGRTSDDRAARSNLFCTGVVLIGQRERIVPGQGGDVVETRGLEPLKRRAPSDRHESDAYAV